MSEQLINPINLVSALRILINASSTPAGPSLETASRLTHHLELPTDWLHAVLSGWQQKASRRTSKSYRKTMTSQTPIRFMSIKLLPKIDLRKYGEPRRGNAICRLCGKTPDGRNRTWHTDCWKAFEPQTSRYWSTLRQQIFIRDNAVCKKCLISVDEKSWKKNDLREWKRDNRLKSLFEVDHIVPICENGSHAESNLELLCGVCHRRKTAKEHSGRAKRQTVSA